jgi:hypothetical protein
MKFRACDAASTTAATAAEALEEAFVLDVFFRGGATKLDLDRLLFGLSSFVASLRKKLAELDFLGSADSERACCFAGDGETIASASSFGVGFFRDCDIGDDLVTDLSAKVYPVIMAVSLI